MAGTTIAAALRYGHLKQDHRYHWGDAHETLLGWGSMFDRGMVPKLFRLYIDQYGKDAILHRKADRIFTILHGHNHALIESDFEELPGAMRDGVALCTLPDHEELNHEARRRALGILGVKYHG